MSDSKNERLKVAFLLYSFIGGGAERVVSILSGELSERFDVHLVLFNGPIDYPVSEQIVVHTLRKEPSWRMLRLLQLPLLVWRYRHYCRKQQIDISISFDNLANYVNATLAFGIGPICQVVLSERNPAFVQFGGHGVFHQIHRWLIGWLYPKAHLIVPCSKGVAFDLAQHVRDLVFKQVYNPLPVAAIREAAAEPVDHQEECKVILHVGSFRSQKRHDLLVRAFAKMNRQDAVLWLVGKGPEQPAIAALVEELGVADQVRFLGFQANPYRFMRNATMLVLSSDFEGFPNVLLEGLACGVPIVAADCPFGPREILAPEGDFRPKPFEGVETARNGLLVPMNDVDALSDGMQLLLEDEHLQNQYREGAAAAVASYDVSTIAQRWEEILCKMVARSQSQ